MAWTGTGTATPAGTMYGWVTIPEANTYMETRLGAADVWVSGAEKAAALQTAYNDIVNCGKFSLPDTVAQAMKDAQFEQALFRLREGYGIDARAGLQAQGVQAAGIVKETYRARSRVGVAICPAAENLLSAYRNHNFAFVAEVTRDEDEDVI